MKGTDFLHPWMSPELSGDSPSGNTPTNTTNTNTTTIINMNTKDLFGLGFEPINDVGGIKMTPLDIPVINQTVSNWGQTIKNTVQDLVEPAIQGVTEPIKNLTSNVAAGAAQAAAPAAIKAIWQKYWLPIVLVVTVTFGSIIFTIVKILKRR